MDISAFQIVKCSYSGPDPGRTLICTGNKVHRDSDCQHRWNGNQASASANRVNYSGKEESKTTQKAFFNWLRMCLAQEKMSVSSKSRKEQIKSIREIWFDTITEPRKPLNRARSSGIASTTKRRVTFASHTNRLKSACCTPRDKGRKLRRRDAENLILQNVINARTQVGDLVFQTLDKPFRDFAQKDAALRRWIEELRLRAREKLLRQKVEHLIHNGWRRKDLVVRQIRETAQDVRVVTNAFYTIYMFYTAHYIYPPLCDSVSPRETSSLKSMGGHSLIGVGTNA